MYLISQLQCMLRMAVALELLHPNLTSQMWRHVYFADLLLSPLVRGYGFIFSKYLKMYFNSIHLATIPWNHINVTVFYTILK